MTKLEYCGLHCLVDCGENPPYCITHQRNVIYEPYRCGWCKSRLHKFSDCPNVDRITKRWSVN